MQKMTRRLKRKYDDFHHVAPVSMATSGVALWVFTGRTGHVSSEAH